jgi:microcystin-dependent protein
MSEPFVGEIIMFGGNFGIRGWALCDGQLLAVAQNSALFSLLGTAYGGDGRTTFGLPDLRGRVPLHQGTGPGLSPRAIGAKIGAEQVGLSANEMPAHNHGFIAKREPTLNLGPDGGLVGEPSNDNIFGPGAPPDTLDASAVGDSGSGNQHPNLMPTQCVSFQIALVGVYPSRN